MTRVIDIYRAIDKIAPYDRAEDWDLKEVLTGNKSMKVSRCLLALDLTRDVILQAQRLGAELIVTHHPLFFEEEDPLSEELCRLLEEKGIGHISAHTNLDGAVGGVDDSLAKALGLIDAEPLFVGINEKGFEVPCGRIGVLEKGLEPREFALEVKRALGCPYVRVAAGDREVRRVAACAGAGSSFLRYAVEKRADAFVTGDVKHSAALLARHFGVTIVDAGHYFTERVVLEPLRQALASLCPEVEFVVAGDSIDLMEVL